MSVLEDIRKAEQDAAARKADIIASAKTEADGIIADAKEKSSETISRAKEEASSLIEQSRREADEERRKFEASSAEKDASMTESAKKNMDSAVNEIIDGFKRF
ncbi:MAG: hypothetical protein ACOX6J_04930 [Oscillospiraceae bacterium]|jgi:vacuolar-type H+-ATPase subunit H